MARFLLPAIHVEVLGRERTLSLSGAARFSRWVRTNDVDVLHVHMRSSLAFVLAMRVTRALRRPLVFHDHYGLIETDKRVPTWFRVGCRFVDEYVGVYEQLSAWARDAGVTADRVTTISNAIDLARVRDASPGNIRRELGISHERLGVLVASFKREKGIDTLIEALTQARHRSSFRIVVAGGATDNAYAMECREHLRRNGLEDAIYFVGARADVPEILASADYAVLTSHSESGPLVLIEYLAAGKPIVATLVGDIGRRLAEAGIPGFVPARDASALARGLDELVDLDDKALRERGEAGRRFVANGWDIQDAMPAWYRVYSKAIERSA